ncbi:MAG: hypothetical protein HOB26_00955 [Flavobacteriales bacterium]|nr:hypothetical protein [Flavobacteriales bacterium]
MKNIAISLALILSALIGYTQPPPGPPPSKEAYEKMKAHKIAYITEKLDLTPEEAQVFWPVYNELETKLHELREANRPDRKKDPETMTDAEVEDMVNQRFEFRQKELDLEKEYHEKYKQVLPTKKVAVLYKAEQGFRRDLLKKLQEKQKGSENRPNGKRAQ